MKALASGLSIGGAALAGASGWVVYRMYLRQRTYEEIEASGILQGQMVAQSIAAIFRLDLNLPPASELAKSIVPIWSTVTPDEAFDDILRRGRASEYWPPGYKDGSPLSQLGIEGALLSSARDAIG
jgi:hypothetical protein